MGAYQPEAYTKPVANIQFFLWLTLLGLPALLLFMIFFKQEQMAAPQQPVPAHHAAHR